MRDYVAVVYHNHGRWKADCPRPDCNNAEAFGPDANGNLGGLAGAFRCRTEEGGCGLLCRALWPERLEEIEWLLRQRHVPATRNWAPGEDLHDLLAENLAHGLVPISPAALEDVPAGLLLAIQGDEISGGRLTAGTWRTEIGGGPHHLD